MSQICPYCGQGFKRLASHEWRCKQKPGSSPQVPSYNSTPNSYGRPSSCSRRDQSLFGFSGAAQFSPSQIQVKQRCPDCGGTYKDLSNHKVCHKRGSGQYADKPQYAQTQICPDCGKSFKDLANHNVCHGRRSGLHTTITNQSHSSRSARDYTPASRSQDLPEFFGFPGTTQIPQAFSPIQMKQRCPDCGGTYKDLSNHKVCHKRGSGKYANKPQYVDMQVCPDCGKSFKNLVNHKICHGRRSRQNDGFRSNTIHSLLTPPPSPQQGINPYFLPSYGSPDTAPRHSSNESSLQPLHSSLYETPPSSPPHSHRHVADDNTEADDSALASSLYQSVQHSHQPRRHRRPRLNDHNGDLDEGEALAIALAASLDQGQTTGPPSPRTSEREVEAHLRRCVDRQSVHSLQINREDIWMSSFRHFKAVKVSDTDKHVMVVFHNSSGELEQAVDAGGPRREYLRLLCEAIVRDSGMLYGNPELGLLVRPSTSKYLKYQFRVLGIMLATIIAQRGQLPAVFAAPVIDAILDDDPMATLKHIPLKYVPDTEIRNSLEKVRDAKDASELEEALEGCQWRYDLDGVPARVTMATREEFVNICVPYFVILKSRPMIDQMTSGLKHCGILGLIRKHKLRHFLEYDPNMTVTSEKVMGHLVPRITSGSEEELRIVNNIREFLEAIENGRLCDDLLRNFRLTRAQSSFAESLKPENLLNFVTGCNRAPAGGFFPLPGIVFQYSDTWRLPHVSTCSNELFITVHQKAIRSSSLAMSLLTSMMNSSTFTRA